MHNIGVLIVLAALVSYIVIGCSERDSTKKIDELVTINLLATSPETGGTVAATGDLRIVFDSAPKSVIVDGIPGIILNNTAFVPIGDLPNVIPGTEKSVIIEWRNPDNSVAGARTITFTVLKTGKDSSETDDTRTDPSNPTTSRVTPPSTGRVTPPRTSGDPPPATAVRVNPAPGAIIPSNQSFQLVFDQGVEAATVNGWTATGSGRNWTVSPALTQGVGQSLNVSWTNRDGSSGSQAVGPYTVRDPDTRRPEIRSGTVADGAADVNPAPINAGGFRFDFDEQITGSIKLTDEAGANLNWIANVAGRTAILRAVAGRELVHEKPTRFTLMSQMVLVIN